MTRARASIVVGLLILSTISWRHGVYYDGGFDSVVVAKAILGCLALALAAIKQRNVQRAGATSYVFLILYLVISLFGASQAGTFLPSFVLSVRVLLIAITVQIVWSCVGTTILLNVVGRLSIGLVLVAAATGFPAWGPAERLEGGIPPITPNELALFSAIGAIWIFWSIMTDGLRVIRGALFVSLVAIIWMTESRTSLVCTVLALAAIALMTRRPNPVIVSISFFMVPAFFYLVAYTDSFSSFIQRGGIENIGTFNNRTLAWTSAVGNAPDLWAALFGQGLSTKEVRVSAEYWDTQPLDSSWASAIVQAGWVGSILLTVWILAVGIVVLSSAPRVRALCVGLLLFVVSRSVLESGLFDATGAFLVFFVLSLSTGRSKQKNSSNADASARETSKQGGNLSSA